MDEWWASWSQHWQLSWRVSWSQHCQLSSWRASGFTRSLQGEYSLSYSTDRSRPPPTYWWLHFHQSTLTLLHFTPFFLPRGIPYNPDYTNFHVFRKKDFFFIVRNFTLCKFIGKLISHTTLLNNTTLLDGLKGLFKFSIIFGSNILLASLSVFGPKLGREVLNVLQLVEQHVGRFLFHPLWGSLLQN